MYARWDSGTMIELITDCNKEWIAWGELFVQLWPEIWLEEIAEMADRMLLTFGEQDSKDFIGH